MKKILNFKIRVSHRGMIENSQIDVLYWFRSFCCDGFINWFSVIINGNV